MRLALSVMRKRGPQQNVRVKKISASNMDEEGLMIFSVFTVSRSNTHIRQQDKERPNAINVIIIYSFFVNIHIYSVCLLYPSPLPFILVLSYLKLFFFFLLLLFCFYLNY